MDRKELAACIDHTLLKPEATAAQVSRLCAEAVENHFAAVCINSCYVPLAHRELAGTPVKVCTVVGFPLGAMISAAKAFEAGEAVAQGADEVDMVINVGALKGNDHEYVRRDIRAVVEAAQGRTVKVILETCLLDEAEKKAACALAAAAGAHFVKTSTGFGSGGATVEDVRLLRQAVGTGLGVKAAGGIRSLETALAMLDAGANRIGTSSGLAIVRELPKHP